MISTGQEVVLLVVVLLFAWNLGAHYTGATVGKPYASRSISLWPALATVATLSLLGATLASGKVEQTVGLDLISQRHVSATLAIVIVGSAGALTMVFNYPRIPTSTIQILVFCVIGAAVAADLSVNWSTLGKLAIVWVAAPVAALIVGFALTKAIDRILPPQAAADR
jgi:PiT family inorganic phosphate transporter